MGRVVGRLKKRGLGIFNGGYEVGLGMNFVEIAILALLVANLILQVIIARGSARNTAQGVQYLDQNLAQALKQILEQLPEALQELAGSVQAQEPPNPIQMMIAEMLKQRMNPTLEVTEIQPQDPGTGRFKKLDDF